MSKQIVHERYVVFGDTHGELVDRAAFECVLQAIEIIRPTGIIMLGDIGEWESINHHRYKHKRQPDPHETASALRTEVRMVRKYLLDPLDKVCEEAGVKKKHMIVGNHDNWINRFVEANPDYADTVFDDVKGYTFKLILNWEERGWSVQPCGELLRIGNLNFYHGHLYGGIHHARNHLLRMGVNIVYGHWHDFQAVHVTHADGPKGAYSLGCLKRCDSDANEWLDRRPINWAHMFGVVDFYKDGLFSVHPVPIIFGRCTLIGTNEVIDGRKPRPLDKVKRGTTNRKKHQG